MSNARMMATCIGLTSRSISQSNQFETLRFFRCSRNKYSLIYFHCAFGNGIKFNFLKKIDSGTNNRVKKKKQSDDIFPGWKVNSPLTDAPCLRLEK